MRMVLSTVAAVALAALVGASIPTVQAQTGERFGLGMFAYQNRTFVGIVMRYPTEPQQIGDSEPTRIDEVAAAMRAISTSGQLDAIAEPMPWCSATQYRE